MRDGSGLRITDSGNGRIRNLVMRDTDDGVSVRNNSRADIDAFAIVRVLGANSLSVEEGSVCTMSWPDNENVLIDGSDNISVVVQQGSKLICVANQTGGGPSPQFVIQNQSSAQPCVQVTGNSHLSWTISGGNFLIDATVPVAGGFDVEDSSVAITAEDVTLDNLDGVGIQAQRSRFNLNLPPPGAVPLTINTSSESCIFLDASYFACTGLMSGNSTDVGPSNSYGVNLQSASTARVTFVPGLGSNTITGTDGDVRLGAVGTRTWAGPGNIEDLTAVSSIRNDYAANGTQGCQIVIPA